MVRCSGRGDWRDNWPGWDGYSYSWRYARGDFWGGELQRYLTSSDSTKYDIIPGGFKEGEIRNGYYDDSGYYQASSMVGDIKRIINKYSKNHNFFRDVFVTSAIASTGLEHVNTANAVGLVGVFCEIVNEEAKKDKEGGELIKQLNDDLNKQEEFQGRSINWGELKKHCARLKNSLIDKLFNDRYFNHTGQSPGMQMLSAEAFARHTAQWFRNNLLTVRQNLRKSYRFDYTSRAVSLNYLATKFIFPHGFIFGKPKYGTLGDDRHTLKKDWPKFIEELKKDGTGLKKLTRILKGETSQTQGPGGSFVADDDKSEDDDSEEATKPVITKAEAKKPVAARPESPKTTVLISTPPITVPKTVEVPPAKVPEAPKEVVPEKKVPVTPPKKPEAPPAKVPEVPKKPVPEKKPPVIPTKTDSARPVATKTEATKPVATKVEATKTEAAKPVVTKAEAAKPTASKPEGAQNQGKKAEGTPNQNNGQSEEESPPSSPTPGDTGPPGPAGQAPTVSSSAPSSPVRNADQPQPPAPLPPPPVPPPPTAPPPRPSSPPSTAATPGSPGQDSAADDALGSKPTPPQVTVLNQPPSASGSSSGYSGGSGDCNGLPKDTIQDGHTTATSHVTSLGATPSGGRDPGSVSQAPTGQRTQDVPHAVQTSHTDHGAIQVGGASQNSPSLVSIPVPGGGIGDGDVGDGNVTGSDIQDRSAAKQNVRPCDIHFLMHNHHHGKEVTCNETYKTSTWKLSSQKTLQTLWDENAEKGSEKRKILHHPYLSIHSNSSLTSNPGRYVPPTNTILDRFESFLRRGVGVISGKQTYLPPPRIPFYPAYRHRFPLIGYEGPDILNQENPDDEWRKKQIRLQLKEFRDKNDEILNRLEMKVIKPPPITLPDAGVVVGHPLNQPKTTKHTTPLPPLQQLVSKFLPEYSPYSILVSREDIYPSDPPINLKIEKPNAPEGQHTTEVSNSESIHGALMEPGRPIKAFLGKSPNSYEEAAGIQKFDERGYEDYATYYSLNVMPNIHVCRDPWHVDLSSPDPTSPSPSPAPDSSNLPPPTTVRGILFWLVGLLEYGYVKRIEKHVEGIFEYIDKDAGFPYKPHDVTVPRAPMASSLVAQTLNEACHYAASVLYKIKNKDISEAIKDFDFKSEYRKLYYSSDPDCLLCQLRDYVYAAHHQVAFLRWQCSRDQSHGGWKDCNYGLYVNVSDSPLQAFLTDRWDCGFDTSFFDPCNICLQSRVRMGFRDDHFYKEKQQGSVLYYILSPLCDPDDPLLTLSSYLFCLTRRTPRTTGELVSFFHNFGNALHDYDSELLSDLGYSFIEHPVDYFFWAHIKESDLDAVRELRGCNRTVECHDHYMTLSTLIGCNLYPVPCPQHLLPITYQAYALYSPSFAQTYLSWTVYLPDRLHESLKRLSINLKMHDLTKCKSLYKCPKAMCILYFHGFAAPDDPLTSQVACSDVIAKLDAVIEGTPITTVLTRVDDFLYRVRKPFITLVFTLWSLAITLLANTVLYRMDVLHIRSHLLTTRASHLIDVKALLSTSRRMLSLYKDVDYFDDDFGT
ncbi:ribosome binding protein, putative [Babesia ovata]|uniref:Ribosome binding protein, putative n=1 Tax=Babesia ovata TaxID=189622 RepID=A0A2H6KB49_9APIC|nr:ribosome binding protein, putative [Babesia ovata]GBE60189.1 ribosome binding protein, putative [Babesia ovata]